MAALNLTITAQYLTVAAQSPHQAYRRTRGSKDQDQRLQVYKQLTLKLNSWLFTYHCTESNSCRTKFNYRHTLPHIAHVKIYRLKKINVTCVNLQYWMLFTYHHTRRCYHHTIFNYHRTIAAQYLKNKLLLTMICW